MVLGCRRIQYFPASGFRKGNRMTTLVVLIGGKTYRMGIQGEPVRQIQLALGRLGYPLSGTGYFGPATDTAITSFQKRAGLVADGEVGPKTAAKIDEASYGKVPAVTEAPRSEITRPLWVEAGLKLIGLHEVPGGKYNPVSIDWAEEEGGEIAKEYD